MFFYRENGEKRMILLGENVFFIGKNFISLREKRCFPNEKRLFQAFSPKEIHFFTNDIHIMENFFGGIHMFPLN
jgi:hypothetical protein